MKKLHFHEPNGQTCTSCMHKYLGVLDCGDSVCDNSYPKNTAGADLQQCTHLLSEFSPVKICFRPHKCPFHPKPNHFWPSLFSWFFVFVVCELVYWQCIVQISKRGHLSPYVSIFNTLTQTLQLLTADNRQHQNQIFIPHKFQPYQ